MKVKNFLLIITLAFATLCKAESGNQELLAGWNEFSKNNFKDVEEHFKAALKDPTTAEDAYQSLAIYHMTNHQDAAALQDIRQFLTISKNPDAAIFAFENTSMLSSLDNAGRIKFYEDLIRMPSIGESIRAMAYERLTSYYLTDNQVAKMKDAGIKTGSIVNWQVLGAFDNVSGSGFSEDFGVVAHSDKSYVFKGKDDVPISWYTLPVDRIKNDRWIDFDFYFFITNAICYAQTFVTVPNDIECQLRLGTSGSYKVWINDTQIMSDEEERNNDLDTYNSTIKLYKGTNRILLQIGASDIDRLNFLLRLTDDKGKSLTGLTYAAESASYNKTYDYKGTLIPVFAEKYYEEKIKAQPDLLLNYFLLSNSYLRNDKAFEAAQVLRDAEKIAPNNIYLLSLKSEQAARAKNYTGLSTILKQMKEEVPDNYKALDLEYDEAFEGENYDKAETLEEKIRTMYGDDEASLNRRISLYAATKQVEKMISAIETGYQKYPDDANFVAYKFALESEVRKDNAASEKVMVKYLKNHQNMTIMDQLMNHYLKTNKVDDATEILAKMIALHPYSIGYLNTMARLNYVTGNYKKAHEYNQICMNMAPYVGAYYELEADIFDVEKKTQAAKEAYVKCITYNPTNYAARTKLRKLNDKPDVFDTFDKPDFKKLYEGSPKAEKYPEDNSVILIDHKQNVVFKNGASMHKNYLMVKVFNESGVDAWKEYYIRSFRGQRLIVEDAYVIKKNGSKVDADKDDDHIVFTNLEVNDAICLSYKLEDYYHGKLAKYLNDMQYFSRYYPVVKNKYELLIDTTVAFQYKMNRSELTPKISNVDEFKKYTWEMENTPAVVFEKGMPELADVAAVLRITSFKSWDDVSQWYASISSSKAKPGYEVKELMKELFNGKEKLSDMEKVKIIYNYVVKEIRYSSVAFRQSGLIPQSTANILNSRIGDCKDISTLFVTMCRSAGLEANLTLISTNDNGDDLLFIPSIDFDHCIANVTIAGKKYYAELTSDCMPFNSYSDAVLNAQALDINPKIKCNLFKLPPSNLSANKVIRTSSITFTDDQIHVKKNTIKTGATVDGFRRAFRDIGKEQQEKSMRESLTDEFPTLTLEMLKFDDNLRGTSDTITYSYNYSCDGAVQDVGGINVIKIPFSDDVTSLDVLAETQRKFPINTSDLWYTMEWDETINLTLPNGRTLMKAPEAKVYNTEFGDYSLTFTPSGTNYVIKRKFKMKTKSDVTPEQYPAFKAFIQKVIKADATQLALK